MKNQKKSKLEKAGWRVGGTQEFLELSDEEMAFIELRLALAEQLREARRQHSITQLQLARLISSSQSRVAKMEACDPSVSSDLLLKGLIALGVEFKDLGAAVARVKGPKPTRVKKAAGAKLKRISAAKLVRRRKRSPALRK